MKTKSQLATRFGVSEKTIDNWASQAQLRPQYQGKRRVFSDADVAAMMAVAGIETLPPLVQPEISVGNHTEIVKLEALPSQGTIEHFRGHERTRIVATDRDRILGTAMQMLDVAEQMLEADSLEALTEFQETTSALQRLRDRRQRFEVRAAVYTAETRIVDAMQNQALQGIEAETQTVKKLTGGGDSHA